MRLLHLLVFLILSIGSIQPVSADILKPIDLQKLWDEELKKKKKILDKITIPKGTAKPTTKTPEPVIILPKPSPQTPSRPAARPSAPKPAAPASAAPSSPQPAAPQTAQPSSSSNSGSNSFRATRIFSGPSQIPPEEFRAYAIVAFPDDPLPEEFERFKNICIAYRTVIPATSEVTAPRSEQLVTVWPVDSDVVGSNSTFSLSDDLSCDLAVKHYGNEIARQAIKDAKAVGHDFGNSDGPFLLAWSPSASKGHRNALTLILDMSLVETRAQAKKAFRFWVNHIEEVPENWYNGFTLERLRLTLLFASETLSAGLLKLVGG